MCDTHFRAARVLPAPYIASLKQTTALTNGGNWMNGLKKYFLKLQNSIIKARKNM